MDGNYFTNQNHPMYFIIPTEQFSIITIIILFVTT